MKRILLFVLLLIPFGVDAVECNSNYISDLRKKAVNINAFYDYKIIDNKAFFTVTIYNITEGLYLEDSLGNLYYYSDTNNGQIVVEDIDAYKYNFKVMAEDEECYESSLTTKYINFPVYNTNYTDPLCDGIEEFELCQKWNASTGDYEYFKEQVNKYKESLIKISEKDKEKKQSLLTRLSFLFVSYYFIIIPIIILVCIIMVIKNKKDRFDL